MNRRLNELLSLFIDSGIDVFLENKPINRQLDSPINDNIGTNIDCNQIIVTSQKSMRKNNVSDTNVDIKSYTKETYPTAHNNKEDINNKSFITPSSNYQAPDSGTEAIKNTDLDKIKPNRESINSNANLTDSDIDIEIQRSVEKITNFEDLYKAIKDFEYCEIKKTAINTVIYDGQLDAKIMCVGEAPGANEDAKGIPFCGLSGKLLDNILNSIGLSRTKNIFITNTVFWRPPGNRRPTSREIELCRPFLEKMISILSPEIIIMVGSTAVESLMGIKSVSMNILRTQRHLYSNKYLNGKMIEAIAIFHPSYLLRQPTQKKLMWFDVLKIAKKLTN
jgi:DNA polymerase